jgi:hypothetical protein
MRTLSISNFNVGPGQGKLRIQNEVINLTVAID